MRKRSLRAYIALALLLGVVAAGSTATWADGDEVEIMDWLANGGPDFAPDFYPGDFNGDGKDDLGYFDRENSSFYVALSNGKRFGVSGSGQWIGPGEWGTSTGQYFVGDFNGDDTDDLGYFNPNNNSFHVNISEGDGFFGPFSGRWIDPNSFGKSHGQYFVGYFNGGKKADLGWFNPNNNSFHVTLSTGTDFGTPEDGKWSENFGNTNGEFLIGDFNGDGSQDLGFFTHGNSAFDVKLSNGFNNFDKEGSGRWLEPGEFGHPSGQFVVGDYDENGKHDLGFFNPSDGSFHVTLSHFNLDKDQYFGKAGSGRWINPGEFGHGDGKFYGGDFNGGDKTDLGFFDYNTFNFHVTLSNGSGFDDRGVWIRFYKERLYVPVMLKNRR
jgi:hypothetical protein